MSIDSDFEGILMAFPKFQKKYGCFILLLKNDEIDLFSEMLLLLNEVCPCDVGHLKPNLG